ncbi:MAG: RNA polymerase sigma factor [Acidobacteriota bacterium]
MENTAEDPSQTEQEYAELRVRLESTVRRICPAWMADRREDLVQVALIKVMGIVRRSEKSRQFSSSYLWRTAQSALIDEIRRHRKRNEVGLEDAADTGVAFEADQPKPDEEAVGRETGKEVWECLNGLVRPRRLAVTLHLEGYATAQAAPLLGWNKKKVYNLVHRGMQDLRECLRAKGLGR